MSLSKIAKLIIFLIGLGLLFFLIYRVGPSEIVKAFSEAKLYYIVSAVFVYILLIATRSLKWFLMVRIFENKIKYRQFLPIYLFNSLMGSITPLKSGEAITPVLFNKYFKIPVGRGFSVIVLDRFFELAIFTLVLTASIVYILNSGIQNDLLLRFFRGALAVIFLALFLMVAALISKRITLRMLKFFRIIRFAEKETDAFYDALPLLKNKKAYLFLTPLTVLCWFFEISSSYLMYNSVFPAPFLISASISMVTGAATFATFIPGGIGVIEVGVAYLFGLFGYSTVSAASSVILARVFLTGTLFISGLLGLIFVNYFKKDRMTANPALKK
ncbi:MAG: flippase-like domain-containing protein [Candidatus Nealsonbacteria bacterium]|nr:flippase-like domain-containing protein [Candidatus Nealsonbacteria bacterium]